MDIKELVAATAYAAAAHRDQRRKDATAAPYINHPIDVMHKIADNVDVSWLLAKHPSTLVAAVLHDVAEDTERTMDDIENMFGKHVASIVDEVSDDKSLAKAERKRLAWQRLKTRSVEAQLVKVADKWSNCANLHESVPAGWERERVHGYLLWSRAMILSLDEGPEWASLREKALQATHMDGMPEFATLDELNAWVDAYLARMDDTEATS